MAELLAYFTMSVLIATVALVIWGFLRLLE